jgi:hypothetical protein
VGGLLLGDWANFGGHHPDTRLARIAPTQATTEAFKPQASGLKSPISIHYADVL